jgi:hypothetical protein
MFETELNDMYSITSSQRASPDNVGNMESQSSMYCGRTQTVTTTQSVGNTEPQALTYDVQPQPGSITQPIGDMEPRSSMCYGQIQPISVSPTTLEPVDGPRTTVSTLQKVPYDVLAQIIRCLNDLPEGPYIRKIVSKKRFRWHLPHPLNAISQVNRHMRDVALPFIYEKISIRGNLVHMVRRLQEVYYLPKSKRQYIK